MKTWRTLAIVGGALLAVPLLWQSSASGEGDARANGDGSALLQTTCPADLVRDGIVNVQDMVEVIARWGPCADCAADIDRSGVVDEQDLVQVLLFFGPCAEADGAAAGTLPGHICALEDGSFVTADGGCKDLATGLVWSTHTMGTGTAATWSFAGDFVAAADEGGFDDWRLPTVGEWQTVIANGAETHFAGYIGAAYWTSDTQGKHRAWRVMVWEGDAQVELKSAGLSFCAVRDSGASPPPPPPPPPGNCNNNGICEEGEDCESCTDCDGKLNGPPSGRYCCGNGVLEGPENPEAPNHVDCDGNP